jgi:hypothetical protein
VVAKHRRAEPEPSLGSAGAPVNTAAVWSGSVRHGQAVHSRAVAAGGGYLAADAYDAAATDPGWAAATEGQAWQDPRTWGPLPELHPDHPSASQPRVRLPADAGDGYGHRRLHAVPSDGSAAYRPATSPRTPQEAGRYPEPATGWFDTGHGPGPDAQWAGQAPPLSDSRAAQIAQEARAYAAALREAAEREAASITQQAAAQAVAIREAAEREAAERRAELDSMTGELGRVAAYVTESLAPPAMPATAPAVPATRPALPTRKSAPPAARPAGPGTSPVRPAGPDSRPARPAKPAGRPAATPGTTPATTPAKQPQKAGRQRQSMRVATYATATLMAFAVLTGAAEIGLHGFNFFVFRGGGVGQTSGSETDQQFLAQQTAAHHAQAPKGRHARG